MSKDEERIKQIRARLDAAVPGEWHRLILVFSDADGYAHSRDEDKEFVLHSRDDLEWALARIAELEEKSVALSHDLALAREWKP